MCENVERMCVLASFALQLLCEARMGMFARGNVHFVYVCFYCDASIHLDMDW